MRKSILPLFSLVTFILAAGAAQAQVVKRGENLVEVTCTGAGMNKEEAVRDAQRKAIEQGAGTEVFSESKTQDFALVKDTVLARSTGFIQEWKAISEKQMADGTFEVQIKAVVSIKGIVDLWGTVTNLLQQMGRPKIMVFISEKIDGAVQEDSTVQTRIENLLLKSGFLLVNREQIKAIDKKDLESAVAEDNAAKIQAIAKRFGAQLFITGSTNASLGEGKEVYGVQLFRYGADGDVKCYRSDTAQLLASENANAENADRTQRVAAKKSVAALGDTLGPKVQEDILKFWMDALEGRGEIQLHVEGLSFAQYAQLKKGLETMKEVKAVKTDYHNKIAECSIQSDVKAEALALKIVESVPALEISDVSDNVIKGTFKAAP